MDMGKDGWGQDGNGLWWKVMEWKGRVREGGGKSW